jgi:hypothetical protein
MERQVRENLGLVTATLTVVSLALVFAAAGRVVPQGAIPRAPDVVFDLIPPSAPSPWASARSAAATSTGTSGS